jgi:hypothetical protein
MPETIEIPNTVTISGEDVFETLVSLKEVAELLRAFNQGQDTPTTELLQEAFGRLYVSAFGLMYDGLGDDTRAAILRQIEHRAAERAQG